MENNSFSFSDIIPVIRRRFWAFVIIGGLAAVLSAVFSGPSVITPRYKSTTIVYPSNISSYSKETRTEQLLQLFESSDIRDSLIDQFDLYRRYDINPEKQGSRFMVINTFNERVIIKKTKYESVEVSVEDESPDTAYLMVWEIMNQLNLKARNLQREKSYEIVSMTRRQMQEHRMHLDSISRRLRELSREYGLLEYEAQTEEVTRGYYAMLAAGKSGASAGVKEAKKVLEGLADVGGEFQRLYALKELSTEAYAEVLESHQRALNDIRKELTYLNPVVHPDIPDKKSYPIRWIIVFTAVFSSLLFTLVLLLIFDRKPRA